MSIVAPTSALQSLAEVGAAVSRDVMNAAAVELGPEAAASPQAAKPAPPSVLAAAVSTAAARQDGLGPLLADLSAALASPTVPPALKAAIRQVVGFQLPTTPPPTAAGLRQAVSQSGLFLEAHLAAHAPPAADFKAALGNLGQALAALADERPAQAPADQVPPPPYRDGPQQGQPAVAASLPANPDLPALVAHLQRRLTGAQSRQLLQQAASAQLELGAAKSWLFELPLAMPQGAAIAQFEIDAEEPSAGAETAERTWRARFTLDLEGVGPVHAHLALRGDDLKLGLFAEDGDAASRLDRDRARLATALQAEALNPQIAIRPGVPQTTPAPAGRFVDSAA